MKDSCNPVYDEAFEYVISQGEVNSRTLEITVITKKTWFLSQSPVMGQVRWKWKYRINPKGGGQENRANGIFQSRKILENGFITLEKSSK